MSADITERAEIVERLITHGDLSKLSPADRSRYYAQVCQTLGLNPLTQPFEYVIFQNRLRLYARKDATEQLRRIYRVSLSIVRQETIDGVHVVHVRATMPDGRFDEDEGAVSLSNLAGEGRANAILKAITKAKRRTTLSICGLGFLDETEVETIPGATVPPADAPALPPAGAGPEPSGDNKPPADESGIDADQAGWLEGHLKQVAAAEGREWGAVVDDLMAALGKDDHAELANLTLAEYRWARPWCSARVRAAKAKSPSEKSPPATAPG